MDAWVLSATTSAPGAVQTEARHIPNRSDSGTRVGCPRTAAAVVRSLSCVGESRPGEEVVEDNN